VRRGACAGVFGTLAQAVSSSAIDGGSNWLCILIFLGDVIHDL